MKPRTAPKPKFAPAAATPPKPTPNPEAATRSVLRSLGHQLDKAQRDCAAFAARFADEPIYAMEHYSDSAFQAAAEQRVWTLILGSVWEVIERNDALARDLGGDLSSIHPNNVLATFEQLRAEAHKYAWRIVKYPSRSTNVGANEMHRALGEAWVNAHEQIGEGIEWIRQEIADAAAAVFGREEVA